MAAREVRQIVVVDGSRLVGVVNERDLFTLTRVSMRQVLDGLTEAHSIARSSAARTTSAPHGHLLAQGVPRNR